MLELPHYRTGDQVTNKPKKVFKPQELEFGDEYQRMLDLMTRLVNTLPAPITPEAITRPGSKATGPRATARS